MNEIKLKVALCGYDVIQAVGLFTKVEAMLRCTAGKDATLEMREAKEPHIEIEILAQELVVLVLKQFVLQEIREDLKITGIIRLYFSAADFESDAAWSRKLEPQLSRQRVDAD